MSVQKTLDRLEKGFEGMVDLLRQVASQHERIHNLEEHKSRQLVENDEIFHRLRSLELESATGEAEIDKRIDLAVDPLLKQVETHSRAYEILTHRYAFTFYGATLAILFIGLGLDFAHHSESLKTILWWVK